ncbi:hypothetical protein QO010_003004 [Caulobacter ginsengisoli]|uniref:LPXTG cell wall anchor domain-containing protein n=1 Tax=Caulobacter ginsengisoli TaxID=400775 RepID=A0ABU0IT81_9CAUL|nr:hypothetical protein [Caulobacter ginsengisoli]MDQ0465217.1 hypothetical protein [Caulobacter ginsengisoli]
MTLQPWTLTIDAQAVLIGLGVVLLAILAATLVARARRAKEKPQDEG